MSQYYKRLHFVLLENCRKVFVLKDFILAPMTHTNETITIIYTYNVI